MLLDSSAVVAIILQEPGWEHLRDRIDSTNVIAINAASLLESHMVLTNRTGKDALPLLDAFTRETGVQVIPFIGKWLRKDSCDRAKDGTRLH